MAYLGITDGAGKHYSDIIRTLDDIRFVLQFLIIVGILDWYVIYPPAD